jgi:hypothetical protein|tara:strand:- start:852 stop:1151 length:300 start_codon:yes stop_codon:yes gene_type:complete
MMKLSTLEKYFSVDKLVFNSLDVALYNVSAIVEGEEHMVTDERGDHLTSRNLLNLQKLLRHVKSEKQVLRHASAYDEMIGGPIKTSNVLEVSLGDNKLY